MLNNLLGKKAFSTRAGTRGYSTAATEAIVVREFGGPEEMKMESKDIPAPGPGQVVVRIGAAGVNPSDTYVRLGPKGPYAGNARLIPELPYTPGKDGAGVVEAVGPDSKMKVGDQVYTTNSVTGTYAGLALCNDATVWALPEGTSSAEGACVGVPCATAYRALVQRGGAVAGNAVLVHGASGAVGLAAIQLAVDLGCFVVGTAGTPAGEAAVKAAGAHAVVNHRTEGYLEEAQQAIPDGASGFDLLLEMAADVNLAKDLPVMGKAGRVCIIGSKALPASVNPRLTMPNELDVRGVFLSNASPAELVEAHGALFDAMERGALRPTVGMELPLAEASTAHVEVMQPSAGGSVGNIVLIP